MTSLACLRVGEGPPHYAAHVGPSALGAHVRGGRADFSRGSLSPLIPSAFCDHAGTRKTRCTVATAMITTGTVCGWSFPGAAAVQAEAAAGVEVVELPEAAMAPHPGDLKTE